MPVIIVKPDEWRDGDRSIATVTDFHGDKQTWCIVDRAAEPSPVEPERTATKLERILASLNNFMSSIHGVELPGAAVAHFALAIAEVKALIVTTDRIRRKLGRR